MKKILLVATIILLALSIPAYAFFNSDVKKAKKFMAAQMYPQAIELLTKRINEKPTDEKAHFLLAECSLQTGNYREAANRFDSAINLEPELKDQAAQTCLKVAEGNKNVSALNQILMIAEKYATNPETQKTIGQKELQLSRQCNGGLQKSLMRRAARYLGEIVVYGFDVQKLGANKVKILFVNDQPVKIFDWKKGTSVIYVEVSDQNSIFRYSPKTGKLYPLLVGEAITSTREKPLILKGIKDEWVIINSNNLSF